MKIGLTIVGLACMGLSLQAATFYTSPDGPSDGNGSEAKPFRKIQTALDRAAEGDTVLAKSGRYRERLEIPRSNITLKAAPDSSPVLDLRGVSGRHGIYLANKSKVRIEGLEIKNNLDVNDGSLIRIEGYGNAIQIIRNRLHTTRGRHAMAITVYGDHGSKPVSGLTISGNWIHDIEAATSEALVLNGNVTNFRVQNNKVSDINNIGIDFIGGEGVCPNNANDAARNGVCKNNTVLRANANYGGGYAAGIYVDGGRNIIIEGNTVEACDLGIEVGAENRGNVTTGIEVKGNLVRNNDKVGIIFGGYEQSVGRVKDCTFTGNTVIDNDTFKTGLGQLCIQWAEGNTITENTFQTTAGTPFYCSELGNEANVSDRNVFQSTASETKIRFVWRKKEYVGLSAYQRGSGQDKNSRFKLLD